MTVQAVNGSTSTNGQTANNSSNGSTTKNDQQNGQIPSSNGKLTPTQSQQQKEPLSQSQSQSPSPSQSQIQSQFLPPYPFLDTFSCVCILVMLPHWISFILVVLYVFMGYSEFLEAIYTFLLNIKLNKHSFISVSNITAPNSSFLFSSYPIYPVLFTRFSLLFIITQIISDSILMLLVYYWFPSIIPYILLLSKALMGSNLTSLKSRYIFDAFGSAILVVLLEYSILNTIRYFEIVRGESLLSLNSIFSSSEFILPLQHRLTPSTTKFILYHLSFHNIQQNSVLMFQLEYAFQFLHSTLSLYIIMHNLNPILRKLSIINSTYSFFESLTSSKAKSKEDSESSGSKFDPSSENDFSSIPLEISAMQQNSINKPKTQNVFEIPVEISSSKFPSLEMNDDLGGEDIVENNQQFIEEGANDDDENVELDSDLSSDTPLLVPTDTGTGVSSWYSLTYQMLNLRDISSPKYVVTANFDNFCKRLWLQFSFNNSFLNQNGNSSNSNISNNNNNNTNVNNVAANLNHPSNITEFQSTTSFANNLAQQPSVPPSSASSFSKQKSNGFHMNHVANKKLPNKLKSSSFERKNKLNISKYQQPLWTFLNAAKIMFSRLDYYSGDYYSQNAIVTTSYGVDDYIRNNDSSPQCFIWFTGETTLAFELHNISLEQLLIKVNGIIWEHVASCSFFGKELIIINGLSPLSQYDIDFVKITINGELVHLTTTTVSTIFENKTVTESSTSSPLATLQRSVVTTQEAIDREKARLKKLKNEWKKKSSQIKNEIDNLNNRSNLSDESRNYKKLDSLRQAIVKFDSDISTISRKSEETRILQIEVEEKYHEMRRKFENETRLFKKFDEECRNKLSMEEDKISTLLSEKNQLLVKKERIISKKLRIHHDVELINNEIESLKKMEISLRVERRKIKSIQREEKFKLLIKDIKNVEKQLRLNRA